MTIHNIIHIHIVLCGTDNIMQNILHMQYEMWRIFYTILSVPQKILWILIMLCHINWSQLRQTTARDNLSPSAYASFLIKRVVKRIELETLSLHTHTRTK